MYDKKRTMGPRRGPRRLFLENDVDGLNARMAYLNMLMRHAHGHAVQGRPENETPGEHNHRQHGRGAGKNRGRGQERILRLLTVTSPISQKELAYALGIRSQSLAEQISKLEDAGYVSRKPDPADGRSNLIELTDAGREFISKVRQRQEADPFDVLTSEEKSQLVTILDRVISGMEEKLPEGVDPRMKKFKEMTFGPAE